MKLASFSYNNNESFGIVTDGGVIDLKKRFGNKYEDLKSFIEQNGTEEVKNFLLNRLIIL